MGRIPPPRPGFRSARIPCVLGLLLVLLTSPALFEASALAQEPFDPVVLHAELTTVDEILVHDGLGAGEMEMLRETLTRIQALGQNCQESAGRQLESVRHFHAAIGEELPDEPERLTTARGRVREEQRRIEARQAECRLLVARVTELQTRLAEERQELRTRELHARDDSLPVVVLDMLRLGICRERLQLWRDYLQQGLIRWEVLLVLLLSLAAAGAGHLVAARMARRWDTPRQAAPFLFLPVLTALTTIIAAGWLLLDQRQLPPSAATRLLAALMAVAVLLARLVRLRRMQPDSTVGLWPVVFWGLTLAVVLCTVPVPPMDMLVSPLLLLVRGVALTLFCYATWALERSCCPGRGGTLRPAGRRVLTVLLLALVAAEWAGYRDLVRFMLLALAGSLLAIALTAAASHLLPPALSGLALGQTSWQRRLRRLAGVDDKIVISGLIWFGWLSRVLLWSCCLLVVLWFWDAGGKWSRFVLELYRQGFALGNVSLKPGRIVQGLLIFCLGWSLLVLVRQQVERWCLRLDTELEPGARETITTLAGYIGSGLVIFFSLLVGGLDFTGLAVVAGALSVGLGFGLKNILENFVSGLILLFERPIRRGDWIQVGSTEGYVKRISVRSTVIQTFENADVIVPNSELIANQVTNLMFDDDRRGRLRIPVGVAYGSDTALVERLLVEVARQHPQVLVGSKSLSDPWVLFLCFGESSLDFELSCYLRDINARLRVRSDLLHAIDRAFREHNIEIPFPQRDVHIRRQPAAVTQSL